MKARSRWLDPVVRRHESWHGKTEEAIWRRLERQRWNRQRIARIAACQPEWNLQWWGRLDRSAQRWPAARRRAVAQAAQPVACIVAAALPAAVGQGSRHHVAA